MEAAADRCVAALAAAAQAHDADAMIALLAPDIIVRSPITTLIRFEGIDQARELFTRVFEIVSDIRFYEVVGGGGNKQVIFWRGRVGKTYLEEANLLRFNTQGQISEMTVFMRAVPGLLAFAAQIAPALASRHGPVRTLFIKAQLAVMALVYRSAEPMVIALSKAGVATKPGV
jgi:hypothetical protein